MYLDPSSDIFQGDIIDKFLFATIPQTPNDTYSINEILPDSFTVRPNLIYRQAMIITQTCDAVRRQFLSVAPIFPIQSYIDALKAAGKKDENILGELSQLKKQKINYYYYVPEDVPRGVHEGYVDLTIVNPLERAAITPLKRIAKLEDYQRHVLAYKLGNLFMRPH